jgi:F-type H+-transporting ATPase subunit a
MLYLINSPLDQFEIRSYVGIYSPFSDISALSLTTFSIYTLIVLFIIYILHIVTTNKVGIIPTRWTISVEALYSTIYNMVISQIGSKGQIFLPFIYSLFIFILFSNLISLVPYNFAIMAQLIFTVSLSMTLWIGVTILGFYTQKLGYFGLFVPSGCSLPLVPVLVIIEGLSYVARSISLGLRLGSNILAGHLLLVILSGLVFDFMASSALLFVIGILPLGLILGIMCLESAIACIQAYVFCILTSSYIKDALYAH